MACRVIGCVGDACYNSCSPIEACGVLIVEGAPASYGVCSYAVLCVAVVVIVVVVMVVIP